MKKKIDFITNSSSSSFILPASIKDTKDVAKQMVDIIFKEWKEFDNKPDEEYSKQIYDNIKKLNKDENIMIPFSCNYETFIFRMEDGRIFVDTCNNHDWEFSMNIDEHFSPDDYVENEEKKRNKQIFVNIESGVKDTKKNLLDIINEEFKKRYLKNES